MVDQIDRQFYGTPSSRWRRSALDPLLSFGAALLMSAMQRKEPVGANGRTHGVRHQADVRARQLRWPERQL
jgi:hypothetical protein